MIGTGKPIRKEWEALDIPSESKGIVTSCRCSACDIMDGISA
jgi:hypothetical protein